MSWYLAVLKKYAVFSGRTPSGDYGVGGIDPEGQISHEPSPVIHDLLRRSCILGR